MEEMGIGLQASGFRLQVSGFGFRPFSFSSMLEVLPTLGLEFGAYPVFIHQKHLSIPGDVSNLRDRQTSNSSRNRFARAGGEKQFVVVTAVQGELQINFAGWLPNAGAGNGWGLDLSAYATLFADMCEIGGKAVTEVDHRRGEAFLPQELADVDPRHGMEVARKIGWPQLPAGE